MSSSLKVKILSTIAILFSAACLSTPSVSATQSYSYDALGRVSVACHALGGDGERATYSHDNADNRTMYADIKTDILVPQNSGVSSPNKRFTLWMQPDSNLVLYDTNSTSYWSSSTVGKGANRAYFQSDGNLVLYDASGNGVWSTNTSTSYCAVLAVANDGNVTITRPDGTIAWQTNTGGH